MAASSLTMGRWMAAAIALVTLAVTACAGLPGQGASVDVITPTRADKVVRDYWSVNEQAFATYNADLLGKIQSTPLLEAQIASIKAAKAAGDPMLKSARPLKKVATFVPHQPTYPAQFVALMETVKVDSAGNPTQDAMDFYYRFAQPSENAPWKANFYVLANLDSPAKIAVARDGFATLLSPGDSTYVVDPKLLPATLARYLNSGVASGSPQGPFAPGHLTTDAVTSLRKYRDTMNKLGYTVELGYQPGQFFDAYRGSDGRAVVLFNLQSTDKIAVPDGLHCIVQPKDNLHRWGGLVAPGSYSQLVEGRLLQFVATDPAKKAGTAIDVPAYVETQVSAETSPADPACR
jgi:hypothetical protein